MKMTLEQAIEQCERFANVCKYYNPTESQEEVEQLADWLRELQERREQSEYKKDKWCTDCEEMDEMKCPDEIVTYGIICEKFPVPRSRFDSYESAVWFTELDQPDNRPFYVVKCVEKFEIIGKVK